MQRWFDAWITLVIDLHGRACCHCKYQSKTNQGFILVRNNAPVAWSCAFWDQMDVFAPEYILACRSCADRALSGNVNFVPKEQVWHLRPKMQAKYYAHANRLAEELKRTRSGVAEPQST